MSSSRVAPPQTDALEHTEVEAKETSAPVQVADGETHYGRAVTELPRNESAESTAPELGTHGPDVSTYVRNAIESLGLGTDPSMNASTTLQRSERFWAAVEPAKRELLEQVRRDMGGIEDAPQTLQGLQEAYCEARLFRTSMFLRLVDGGGPITNKGKTKALYKAYLEALREESKLAQLLGLERRARRIGEMGIHEYLAQQQQQNGSEQGATR